MKGYTDLEQSKVLAEILPIESSDMHYEDDISVEFGHGWHSQHIPCWSLAALLDVLPPIEGFKPIIDLDINQIRYEGNYRDELIVNNENLIDACYKMILKLHELKML